MSKALPVYELGQWIERDDRTDKSVGFVVAKMSDDGEWKVHADYTKRKDVDRFSGRGPGYLVQWVVIYDDKGLSDWGKGPFVPHSAEPNRLCWLMAVTIAEKRYQPCENPVKAPVSMEVVPSGATDDHYVGKDSGLEASFRLPSLPDVAPSQPVLPLDIEAAKPSPVRASAMRVTVQSPPIDVTLEQVTAWLLRNGFEALDDRAIDSHGFRHIWARDVLVVPKQGCYDMSKRMSRSIEDCAGLLGVQALTILREMSEVVP